MHFSHDALLAAALFFGAARSTPLAKHNPTVTVSQGEIIGTTTSLAGATATVNKFLSIPFAVSPPERFLPPQANGGWTSPLKAQKLPPACIQQFDYPKSEQKEEEALFNNPGGPPPPESEDCLYLNVFAPAGANENSGLPVLFWIFGGNLVFGTGSLEYYDGSSFAYNQDVIIVTHNYRTNVFGFSNSPEIPTDEINVGFLDQRAALAWTAANIASFGGDPSKITIFGESAGGYSVKQLLAQPPQPLNFRAAIMESEAALISGNGTKNWETLLKDINCTTLACAQQADAQTIKQIIDQKSLGFGPVQSSTETSDIRPFFTAGTAAKVPIMIGTNQDEGRPFVYILGLDGPGSNLINFLKGLFPGNKLIRKVLKEITNITDIPYVTASDVITDLIFKCPASMIASMAQNEGYSVFRYLFNATFPNTQLFPDAGVWHSSEIPEVFGTYPGKNAFGSQTAQEVKLSAYMQTAWANFAKDPTTGPGWPEYGSAGNVGNLGGVSPNRETTIAASSIDTTCAIYDLIIDEEGL